MRDPAHPSRVNSSRIDRLIAARRLVRAIETGADGRDITDTWLPFLTVSTNLTRSRLDSATAVSRRAWPTCTCSSTCAG